jgi:hypothetical protein
MVYCIENYHQSKSKDRRIRYKYNLSFVELLLFLFGVLGGMCDVDSCNVFLLSVSVSPPIGGVQM